ncbi:MAG: CBS domain-containing protein [Methanomassiliicoccales archaeon]|nr:CBS domain-containing protein [Methanomassiliicoccales archaeon]
MRPDKRVGELTVGELGELAIWMPPTVQKSATIGHALDALLSNRRSMKVYVIDVEGNLVGVVTSDSLMKLLATETSTKQSDSYHLTELSGQIMEEGVERAMLRPRPIKADALLKEAISTMKEEHLADLPIVDDDYKLVGELVGLELLRP